MKGVIGYRKYGMIYCCSKVVWNWKGMEKILMRMLFKVRFVMKMFVIDCMFLFFKIIMMISKFLKMVNMEINLYKIVKSDNILIGIWNGFFIFFIWLVVKFEILFINILKDVLLLFI